MKRKLAWTVLVACVILAYLGLFWGLPLTEGRGFVLVGILHLVVVVFGIFLWSIIELFHPKEA